MRKTVRLEKVAERVNNYLRQSKGDDEAARKSRFTLSALLTDLLLEADAYDGFGYLTKDEVPAGLAPGIVRDDKGDPSFPDDTRRYYYVGRLKRRNGGTA